MDNTSIQCSQEDYKFFGKDPETLEYFVRENYKSEWMEHVTKIQDELIKLYAYIT